MQKISYAVKIDLNLAEKVRKFCLEHGVKQGFFIEKAIKEQLAREEDIDDALDFKTLKSQENEATDFESYLQRKKH